MIGTLDDPPGLVADSQNRLTYIPRAGVHGTDEIMVVFSDCLSEGEPRSLPMSVSAPTEQGTFSPSAFYEADIFLLSGPNQVAVETLDFGPVLVLIEEVLETKTHNLSGIVWRTTALGVSAGERLTSVVSVKEPKVDLNLGVAYHGSGQASIEIWLTDKFSGLTFRVKFRLLLCDTGALVDDLAINGRNVCLVENDNLIKPGVLAFGYIATSVSWFLSLFFLAWIFRHRNDSLVKVSQIEFLVLICVGTMISSSTLIALSVQAGSGEDTSAASTACAVAPFLYTIGWVLTYSSLSAKTYRLYKIMESHKNGQPGTVTSWSMFRIVVFAFCVDMAFVIAFTIVNPLVVSVPC